MAERRPDPQTPRSSGPGSTRDPGPFWGVRSAPQEWRAFGFWRRFRALILALLLPAGVAWAILSIAGTPGIVDSDGLRRALLIVLTVLAMTPLPGWLVLPLAWPLLYIMAVRGVAGLLGCVAAAWVIGGLSAHVFLHGDLTTEAPAILPLLLVALTVQGWVGWTALWLVRKA